MSAYRFSPMTEADARAVLAWRYPEPYTAYNAPDLAEPGAASAAEALDYLGGFLDPRNPYFAVRDDEQTNDAPPLAFFAYGRACEVGAEADGEPRLRRPDGSITIGLGLRPDLAGQGRGLALVEAGLALARERWRPTLFRLYVYAWNQRAIRVYERAGFVRVGETRIPNPAGERVFIEMTRSP